MTKLISAAAMFVGSLLLAEASFREEGPMTKPKALFSTMQKGILFSVSAPKEFKAGSPFVLSLKLTNNRVDNITIPTIRSLYDNKLFDYQLEVKDSKGNLVPSTTFANRWVAKRYLRKWSGTSLRPGETSETQLNLSLLFDLTGPDEYTLTVSQNVRVGEIPAEKTITLKIESIRFQITSPW